MLYRMSIKSNLPLCLLLIFQQYMQIFAQNFTQLLKNKIYTSPTSFVDIHLKMIKKQFQPLFLSNRSLMQTVLSKVDDFATFKKVEVHAENSTF